MIASTKKLEIHVSSSLSNKQKHSSFIKTKNFHILITLSCHMSCHRHHHNCRLMDCWFYKTLEIHVNRRFSNRKNVFKETETSLFWWYNKDRHDYRISDGCFHKFVAIHISNSFSSKQKKSAFKQIEFFCPDDVITQIALRWTSPVKFS